MAMAMAMAMQGEGGGGPAQWARKLRHWWLQESHEAFLSKKKERKQTLQQSALSRWALVSFIIFRPTIMGAAQGGERI